MLKTLIFLLTLGLPLTLLADAKTVERVKDLKAYLAQLEIESPHTLVTETGRSFKLSLSLFAEAVAAFNEECFYGGWASKKVMSGGRSYCTSPKNGADQYSSGTCSPATEIQCQPQLFGPNLCVGFTTKDQRINTFRNCENAFKQEKRDYSFVEKMSPQEKEQLKVIEALASSLCGKDPSRGTEKMCNKILKRVSGTKVDLSVVNTPVVMTPVAEDIVAAAVPVKEEVPGLSEAECAAIVTDDFKKIEDLAGQMAEIVSKYGDKSAWPREDKDKGEVVDLQEEVLCLEMEIFSLSNKLDLKINCKANPKKLPPMHMTLVKNSEGTNFDEMARESIKIKIGQLYQNAEYQRKSLESNPTLSAQWKTEVKDRVQRYMDEAACLAEIETRGKCEDSYSDMSAPEYRTKGDFVGKNATPMVTVYVEKDGKLLPFKTFDQVKIQGAVGPKIKQGDMMTPEGTFNITTPTTSTNYFTASKIDYENWKERKDMLAGLPNSMINPGDKGGAILIHGAGGSNGCLSFNSNTEAAYFTAIARNKTKAGQSLKMSVYPAPLTPELIESSSSMEDLKIYKNFWNKLSVNYNKEKARTDNTVSTINDIKDQQVE